MGHGCPHLFTAPGPFVLSLTIPRYIWLSSLVILVIAIFSVPPPSATMPLRRSLRAMQPNLSDSDSNMRTRSRITRAAHYPSSVTVSRYSSEETEDSLLLVFKMPSGKLREATGNNARAASRRNVFTEDPIVSGPRTSRPKKKMVEIDTSDEDEFSDQEEDDDVDDEDAPGDEDDDEDADADADGDADADADADADGDLDMDDAPPQPPNRRQARAAAPPRKQAKSVEAKEMESENAGENDDEDEMSEMDSDAEGEPDDDATGGVDMDEEEDDDEGLDSDEDGDNDAKMTKRQRGSLGNDFLQLPMGE